MKVFWSWQSDTPGKTGRFFVRDALKAAIEELQTEADVLEPNEREVREALHLDHDRKDQPGSPDLANIILEKIKAATVVVADVTTVGIVPPDVSAKDGTPKRLINSNVAIELGYALDALTDRALLMVMNTHYGDQDGLPFDLRHKAGPLLFNLAPDANKAEIAAAAAKLKVEFVTALKPYIALAADQARIREPFPVSVVLAATGPAIFFPPGAVLASAGDRGEQEFRFDHDKLIYLRLFPVGGGGATRAKVAKVFGAMRPSVLSPSTITGGLIARNEWRSHSLGEEDLPTTWFSREGTAGAGNALQHPPHHGQRTAQARSAALGNPGDAGAQDGRLSHHRDLRQVRSDLLKRSSGRDRRCDGRHRGKNDKAQAHSSEPTSACGQQRTMRSCETMVGGIGIEPMTFAMSTRRSPAELTAQLWVDLTDPCVPPK